MPAEDTLGIVQIAAVYLQAASRRDGGVPHIDLDPAGPFVIREDASGAGASSIDGAGVDGAGGADIDRDVSGAQVLGVDAVLIVCRRIDVHTFRIDVDRAGGCRVFRAFDPFFGSGRVAAHAGRLARYVRGRKNQGCEHEAHARQPCHSYNERFFHCSISMSQ